MPKEIKNVIFDLGNTLVFFDHNYFFSGVASYEKRFSTTEFRDYIVENKLMDLLATGKITGKKFYSDLKKKFHLTISYKKFVKIYTHIFWTNNPMELLLKSLLKSKKYKIFLLSNTDDLHIKYVMRKFPHLDKVRNRILSYKVGHLKPSKEIYRFMLDKYDMDPSESLLIDDMQENILAGKKLGLIGHHYISYSEFVKKFSL